MGGRSRCRSSAMMPPAHTLVEQLTAHGIDCGGILAHGSLQDADQGAHPRRHAARSRQQIVRYDIEDTFVMTGGRGDGFAAILRDAIAGSRRGAHQRLRLRRGAAARRGRSQTDCAEGKAVTLDSRYDLLRVSRGSPLLRQTKKKPPPPPAPRCGMARRKRSATSHERSSRDSTLKPC